MMEEPTTRALIDPDPREFTDAALHCAIAACSRSKWRSDRQFASACVDELNQRMRQALTGDGALTVWPTLDMDFGEPVEDEATKAVQYDASQIGAGA